MMDAVGYGFYRVWMERAYLIKLAFIPFLIKFACAVAVFAFDLQGDILRQGLILFPAAMAQGWVLAQLIRTLLKGERWPTILPETIDDKTLDRLLLRARGIVACILSFSLFALLINLFKYFFVLTFFGVVDFSPALFNEENMKDIHITNAQVIGAFALLGAGFWAFRLVWVYIPLTVLMPVKEYLMAVRGAMTSVKMLVLYMCVFTPVTFVTIMLSRFMYQIFGTVMEDAAQFLVLFVLVVSEFVISLVVTTAFVYALKNIIPHERDLMKDMPQFGDKK